jgi:nitrate reductase NapAB chaperone NapD
MRAYMALTCKIGSHDKVLKELLDLTLLREEIFLLFGPIDVIIPFTRLKSIDEFVEKWFNPIRMIGAEKNWITKTLTCIVLSEGPLMTEEPFAFVFLNTIPKDLEQVQKSLLNIPKVLSADSVFGPYDIICSIKADNREDLNQTVINIQTIPGVENSMTAIVAPIKIYSEW